MNAIMISTKTMFLHIGGPKTGSTFIQNAFYMNQKAMADAGVDYKNDHRKAGDKIWSGNGGRLYRQLQRGEHVDVLCETVKSYFGSNAISVCSHEGLCQLNDANWANLLSAAAHAGVAIEIIFVVRNVYPFMASSYDQFIKRHGGFERFSSFAEKHSWSHIDFLRKVEHLEKHSRVHVLHYESLGTGLFDHAVGIIGLAPGLFRDRPMVGVNRSLRTEERDLLRLINERFGSRFSRFFSDHLLDTRESHAAEPESDADAATLIERRYSRDVAWANTKFFGGRPVLALGLPQGTPKLPQQQAVIAGLAQEFLLFALQGLANMMDKDDKKSESSQQESSAAIVSILDRCGRYSQMQSGTMFDNLFYLLRYDDVRTSAMAPLDHFLNIGKQEGRVWRGVKVAATPATQGPWAKLVAQPASIPFAKK
jgi:hypothetical protein